MKKVAQNKQHVVKSRHNQHNTLLITTKEVIPRENASLVGDCWWLAAREDTPVSTASTLHRIQATVQRTHQISNPSPYVFAYQAAMELEFGSIPRKKRSGRPCNAYDTHMTLQGVRILCVCKHVSTPCFSTCSRTALSQNGHQHKEGWTHTAHLAIVRVMIRMRLAVLNTFWVSMR